MTTIFYLFSNVFHIYATYQFSNVFLQKKKESAKSDIVLFTLYYIINSCAYLLFGNWIINLLSNFVPYCLIAIYHKNKFIYSIGSSFILCAVLIVLDTLVVAIQSVLNIHSIFFEQGFVSNIVMVAFVNIVSHSFFKKNQLNVSLPVMYYITVIIIPFVSIIIGYLTAVKLNIVSLICSVIILLINVCCGQAFL